MENALRLLGDETRSTPAFGVIEESLTRARACARRRSSPARWWSGSLIDEGWTNLHAARAALVLLETGSIKQAELPHMPTLARDLGAGDPLLRVINALASGQPKDRLLLSQLVHAHDLETARLWAQTRQLRNQVLAVSVLVALVLTAASIAVPSSRATAAAGGTAGALWAILLVPQPSDFNPFETVAAQVVLKVVTGAALAYLGTLVLAPALGPASNAATTTVLFFGVLFGLGQQVLTRSVDTRARLLRDRLAKRSETRSQPRTLRRAS